jgi:O-antigen ligase
MIGLCIISVSRIHMRFPILAALRPGLVLVVLAAFFAFSSPKKLAGRTILQTWPARVTSAFLVLACLSAPFGISLGGSGSFILSDYSKTIAYAFLLMLSIRSARDLYTLAWAYVLGTGVLVWMALFLFQLSTRGSKAARLGELYSYDANDIGVVLLVGLAMTLLTFQTSRKWGRWFSAVVLVGVGVAVARTGSRGGFLGFIAVGLALLFMLKSISVAKRIGFVVAAAGAVVLFAPKGYWDQMATITTLNEDYNWSSTDGRKQVALRGTRYMFDHPFFGLGIDNFSRAECLDPESEKVRRHVSGTGLRCTAPHNSYVQAGAELGIPGLVLWLTLVFGSIPAMFKLRRRLPPAWARGTPEERFLFLAPLYLGVAMVGFAVSSTFVSFAWLDIVYYLAAMMAGLYSVTARHLSAAAVPVASSENRGRRFKVPTAALRAR